MSSSFVNNFYYFGVCHFCKTTPKELRRCSGCKIVAYCSKEHQKLDWRNHRELCKVITFTFVNDNTSSGSFDEWTRYRLNMQRQWVSLLKRDLQPFECQMWMFPRVCNWCYINSSILTDCPKCCNVTYCSNEHLVCDRGVHKKFCTALRLCMDIDRYLSDVQLYPQIDLKQVACLRGLPEGMSELLNLLQSEENEESVICKSLKSEALSPGSVIAYSIQESLHDETTSNDKYVIHIVGAAAAEGTTDWILTSELLLHSFNNIQELLFILIGPEAVDTVENINLCQTCKSKGKKVSLKVHKDLYHNVVENIEKPDLVLALNCGLHEFEDQACDDWYSSIPFMIISNIPFVFTSYTHEEMLKDINYMKKFIPDVELYIVMACENPFASLRPIRDWCTKDIPVFYSNAFITIVKAV